MRRVYETTCALALAAIAGGAALAGPAGGSQDERFTTTTAEDVRRWVSSRGEAAQKDEVVEVDLVFNFMKGTGCTDEDAEAAAKAAAMRANELLKGACVTLNVKEVNNNWTGPGNMDPGADGEVNGIDIVRASREGLKEVTGDDGMGGTKKGYKVFIVEDFIGDQDATVGVTIKCEPWTAIQKDVDDTSIGEIMAHEIGHSFGKLDDTYEMDDMNCLMYGYVKEDSPRMLKEGQGEKIKKGAQNHGRTVKRNEDEPDEAPKRPKAKADGGLSRQQSEPLTSTAGEVVFGNIVSNSFLGDVIEDTVIDFTVARSMSSPAPTYIHLGIDLDNDPATGDIIGPFEGIEIIMRLGFDFVGDVPIQMEALDLVGTNAWNGPAMLGDGTMVVDEFGLPGAPIPPLAPVDLFTIGVEIPHTILPIVVGPAPAMVHGVVSPQVDPLALPLPNDQQFWFPLLPDDFFGRPIVEAPGVALPGLPLPIDGVGFPPNVPLTVCVDTQEVATVNSGPSGQFTNLPIPMPPVIAAPSDFAVITVKPAGPGASGFTWVGLPPVPPCPADLDGNGFVDTGDLGILLAAWGQPLGPDLDGDGFVGPGDLGILLAAWGPCP